MASRKKNVERRQHKRYPVKDVSGVIGKRRSVQIIDMCRAGLSFRYVQRDNISGESIEMDVLSGLTGLALDNLPGRIVSDHVLTYETSFHPVIVRRCSLQLLDLTQDQLALLEKFIQDHAENEK